MIDMKYQKKEPLFKQYISQLDAEFSKSELLVLIQEKTKIPKVYSTIAVGALISILVYFNLCASFIVNMIGYAYPAYKTYVEITEAKGPKEFTWSTYWIIYGFLNMVEYFGGFLLYWLPNYYFFKLLFIIWLVNPRTRGAQVIWIKYFQNNYVIVSSGQDTK